MLCDGSDFTDFDGFSDLSASGIIMMWFRRTQQEHMQLIWKHEQFSNHTQSDAPGLNFQSKVQSVNRTARTSRFQHAITLTSVSAADTGWYWCTIQAYGYTVGSNKGRLELQPFSSHLMTTFKSQDQISKWRNI